MPARSVAATMKRTARSTSALVLGLAGLLGMHDADAACTGVGLFSCSATVSVSQPLAFGNYNPANATPADNTTTIKVVGTITGLGILVRLSYTIGLDAGAGGTIADRRLAGPSGGSLPYNLYTTNARTLVWGAAGASDSYDALASLGGTSVTNNYTVYGRIPVGQYVVPGAYSNIITVTVTY
ncbi:spore coat protein U-like protein [Variovorax boronicumulans]|uniref:Csu type fimbrial protein n=1 Tax=Variovorax boronicumulans TaxID=436515 RepID=UPI0024771FF2|nr:spore coat U domain-containing protein [Variovorax boronicumulans]MDH6166442.1 spore coat protein U-like protein [Variovorax boronicumulans]